MNTLLTDYLSRLDLRDPHQFKNIVVVPVFAGSNGEPEYLTLTEALAQRLATITEVSVRGQVPNVKVPRFAGLFSWCGRSDLWLDRREWNLRNNA